MLIQIVNDKDEIIGLRERATEGPGDITRISGLIILNDKNEILMGQRSFSKRYSAGKWNIAVGGTLEEGETYESNIIKEAKEEVGLTITESDLSVLYYGLHDHQHRYFFKLFISVQNLPIEDFVKQDSEIEELRWIGVDEFIKLREEPELDNFKIADSFWDMFDVLLSHTHSS